MKNNYGFFIISIMLCCSSVFAQAATKNSIVSTYPLDKAKHVNPAMTIGIRFSSPVTINDDYSKRIVVQGSKSGIHQGLLSVSDDKRTLIFKPSVPFKNSETVEASFPALDASANGCSLSFTVAEPLARSLESFHSSDPLTEMALHGKDFSSRSGQIQSFPQLSVVFNDNPAPGNLYLANFRFDAIQQNVYRMVLDNQGQVISAETAAPRYSLDFRQRPDGGYSYFDAAKDKMYILDSRSIKVDSLVAANGYQTDGHDLLYTNEGGYMILAIDPVTMDMRPYYEGGFSNASVLDIIIQEFDRNKNLLWEWRSLDHFKVSDCIGIGFADSIIDYCHANALDTDRDGHILLSSRHMDEITKIDRNTGAIRWRWGGANNQFTFIGDTIHFSYQHDIRRTPTGTFTLFDNGDYHQRGGIFSRGIEYKIDEEMRTATKVWEYRHSPDVYGMALGSVQRLPNGNTLIGWGACDDVAITEVDTANNRTFELVMDNQNYSYRAYKYTPQELSVETPREMQSQLVTTCYPNPASSQTTVAFSANSATTYSISLWDQLGRSIKTLAGKTALGTNAIPVDITGIIPGTYYIKTAVGSELSRIEKLIIQ